MKKIVIITKVVISFLILTITMDLFPQDTIVPPPTGYDKYNKDIPHGKMEIVSYYSSTVGIERKTRIYLPAGYTPDSTYNVLYLLHGIGGDINEWYNNGSPQNILDNLNAKDKIAPMILALPNGRAMVDDSPGSDIFAADKVEGFANFEFELIKDLIPFIDTTYSVKPGREARAIAGLSMGGGQALNFGLAHLDTFAWVGAFSPAPNTKPADSLIPNLAEDTSKIMALWISCGGDDDLQFIAENTHIFMVENNIDHSYWIQPDLGHDWSVWKPGLYHFSQRIFGMEYSIDTTSNQTADTSPLDEILKYPSNKDIKIIFNRREQTLAVEDPLGYKDLRIYDLNGRLELSCSNLYSNININHLSEGVYIVVLFDGEINMYSKIVKL